MTTVLKKIIPVLFLLLIPLPSSALLITEVQVAGEESVNDCYIKIYNPASQTKNISGYNLRKRTASGNESSVRVFPEDSTIEPNNYFIWASSRNENFPQEVNADAVSTQYLANNNSIALLDNERQIIDAVAWGVGVNQFTEKTSYHPPKRRKPLPNRKGLYALPTPSFSFTSRRSCHRLWGHTRHQPFSYSHPLLPHPVTYYHNY